MADAALFAVALDLALVRSVRAAVRADLVAAGGVPGALGTLAAREPYFEPRPVHEPTPRFEPRKVHEPEPRIEPRAVVDVPVARPKTCDLPPPWRMKVEADAAAPQIVSGAVKRHVVVADARGAQGALLDLFA